MSRAPGLDLSPHGARGIRRPPFVGRLVPLALGLGLGCALLEAYPGGEDPGKVLTESTGDGSFDRGDNQEPLVDPATDTTISATSEFDQTLAFPGEAFIIDLNFTAQNANVVGGGIRFPGSNEVQWTFIEGLEGETGGEIRFGYVVAADVCSKVPNLCHLLQTEQFAVARNVLGDVDGDGVEDGEFVVSPPAAVDVILNCASCESPSCQELLAVGECQTCNQKAQCQEYFDTCLDPEMFPEVSDDDVDAFNLIFGPNGALWTSRDGCVAGELACENAVAEFMSLGECRLGGGASDEGGSGSGGM
jgi:hypothetical protein